jgi:hypothetical protein
LEGDTNLMSFRDFMEQLSGAEARRRREEMFGRWEAMSVRESAVPSLSASDRYIQAHEGVKPMKLLVRFIKESIPELVDIGYSKGSSGEYRVNVRKILSESPRQCFGWNFLVTPDQFRQPNLSALMTKTVRDLAEGLQAAKIRRNFEELDRINISNGVYSRDDLLDATTYAMTQAFLFGSDRTVVSLPNKTFQGVSRPSSGMNVFDDIRRSLEERGVTRTYTRLQERCRTCRNRNKDFDRQVARAHLDDLKCAINPSYAKDGVGECADYEAEESVLPILQALINRLQAIPSVQRVDLEYQRGFHQWSYGILVYANGQRMRRFALTEKGVSSATFFTTAEAIVASVMEGDR